MKEPCLFLWTENPEPRREWEKVGTEGSAELDHRVWKARYGVWILSTVGCNGRTVIRVVTWPELHIKRLKVL